MTTGEQRAEFGALLTLAYLTRLEQRCPMAPLPVVELPARAPRLDDTGRAPIVALRPNGGDGA